MQQEVIGTIRLVIRDATIFLVAKVHHYYIDLYCRELFEIDICLLALLKVLKSKLASVDLAPDKVPLPADDAFLVLSSLSQVQPFHGPGCLDILKYPEIQLDLLGF